MYNERFDLIDLTSKGIFVTEPTWFKHFMAQYHEQTYVQNLDRLWRHYKNDIIFKVWPWRHNKMSLTEKTFFKKIW